MRSIVGQLVLGLVSAGIASAIVLIFLVGHQYGFFRGPLPPLSATLREIVGHIVIPLTVFLALFGLGAFWVIRSVARKLEAATKQVVAAAQHLESYDASNARLPLEIEPFANAVALLTSRLEAYGRRQEAFAADAAHELKTPLAALSLELDRLSSEDANRLRGQLTAMNDMVEQFLLLARSHSAESLGRAASIELQAVGRGVAGELAPSAVAQGKTLAFQSYCEPQRITGLDEAIAAAVRTLVVNAIRATPEGGQVLVDVTPGPCLRVFDGGEGIVAEQLERLKARGVRADRSSGGAAGLGLAIADRIAEAHGAELQTCLPARAGLQLCFMPRMRL